MPQHLCPRCRTALPTSDPGTLLFCSACGAPQVRVPDDIGTSLDASESTAGAILSPWPGAMQIAALCAAFAGLLALLSIAFPPISLISVLWAISAPFIVLRLFISRFPTTPVTSGFGARLGLLTAFFLGLGNSAINVGQLLLMRFAFHKMATIDTALNTAFNPSLQNSTQMAQLSARLGTSPASAEDLAYLQHVFVIPEFRVGTLLGFALFLFGTYLFYASLAGAFAGLIRSRAR